MRKFIIAFAIAVVSTVLLVACGGKGEKIEIWVGTESLEFYEEKLEDFKTFYEEENGEKLKYKVTILAMDTGTAATTFMDDPKAGADLFTVAHDNLGKLVSGSSAIAPVKSEALLKQISDDNPEAFLDVIKATVDGTAYTFGIPYIAQSLVLYYDKESISSEQVKSWEGMMEAAQIKNTKAMTVTGTDGYNNSFLLLATNAETGATSLKLYPSGVAEDSFGAGDDTVSIMKWGQRFFNHTNGGKVPDSDGWEVALQNGTSLSVISGAWHYNAAKASLGSKLGIAILPTFEITEADAFGTVTAGTVFRSGTFADTKMFVMKKGMTPEKQAAVEELAMYFSSKEVQEESYQEANNLPAYKNAATEFESMQGDSEEALLARIQIEMFEHGIAQPFGAEQRFNLYYYSKQGPERILAILENKEGLFTTHAQIKAEMEIIQKIWRTGSSE